MQYDFVKDCIADPTELTDLNHELDPDRKPYDSTATAFQRYIDNIRNDKNLLVSHITNVDDDIKNQGLESSALVNLRDFILYLNRLGWGNGTD